ncbi:MAG: cyclase family protein [Dermatophilaceae bacterium]|nr:cyclase family protein [Dermatophilaceae bacterium]
MTLWDISALVGPDSPIFPGDEPYAVSHTATIGPGCPVNLTALTLSPHIGAHVDAPIHFSPDGGDAASLPLEPFLGVCRVVHLIDDAPDRLITRAELAAALGIADMPDKAEEPSESDEPNDSSESDESNEADEPDQPNDSSESDEPSESDKPSELEEPDEPDEPDKPTEADVRAVANHGAADEPGHGGSRREITGIPQRVLVRTRREALTVWRNDFAAFDADALRWLATQGVVLVGIDTPSVDPAESKDLPAHQALRDTGIVNLENLVLDHVPAGDYELIALPLRLVGACASPVRAVLRALP